MASELSAAGAGSFNSVRQRIREFLYDGKDRARPSPNQLDVRSCFAPMMKWALSLWESDELVLALDPTLKGDEIVAIAVSVVYRGNAIPVAWHILPANRKGEWMRPAAELLRLLAEGVPSEMEVAVLCDGGLRSPLLWNQICELGWHPYVRQAKNTLFRPEGGKRRKKAVELVNGPGEAWIGWGEAFSAKRKRRHATMIVYWEKGNEQPCLVMTDQPPDKARPRLYAMRFWIELGFRTIKSVGWQWQNTRRTDPDRVSRHWLVLALATLLTLAHGTRVEDAGRLGKEPANVRTPPKVTSPEYRACASGRRRQESVLIQGTTCLRRLLLQRRVWKALWLLPDACPQTPPAIKVTYGV